MWQEECFLTTAFQAPYLLLGRNQSRQLLSYSRFIPLPARADHRPQIRRARERPTRFLDLLKSQSCIPLKLELECEGLHLGAQQPPETKQKHG